METPAARFGLPPFTYQTLVAELARYPQIERVVVFGSRAKGTHRPGSDVDLCLFGPLVTPALALTISARLNEALPIPYFFDVLAFDALDHAGLRAEILHAGRALPLVPAA